MSGHSTRRRSPWATSATPTSRSLGTAWFFGTAANGTNVNNVYMLGDFLIDGNGCDQALYSENTHRGRIEFRARNVAVAAATIKGSVLMQFDIECSINVETMSTVPTSGVLIDGSPIITNTTICDFRLVLEGIAGAASCATTSTPAGSGGPRRATPARASR
jgi:hypothetical protein